MEIKNVPQAKLGSNSGYLVRQVSEVIIDILILKIIIDSPIFPWLLLFNLRPLLRHVKASRAIRVMVHIVCASEELERV